MILQLGIFEHLNLEQIPVDVSYSMSELAIELINANLIPEAPSEKRIFWNTIARIFLIPNSVNMNFLYHFTSLWPILTENFLGLNDFTTAKNLITKLVTFGQISKKNFLLDMRTPLIELNALFNFLDSPDEAINKDEQLQIWFAQARGKKNVIKCLSREFIDTHLVHSKEYLLAKLIAKLVFFQDALAPYLFSHQICALQTKVFAVAKIFDVSPEQYEFLEKCFGHEKDLSFEWLEEQTTEEKPLMVEERKKEAQSIVEQSMFKPLENVILRSQLPEVLIELALKCAAFFPKDGILVLSGGAVCNLKEAKTHLGDYDCLIELDDDLTISLDEDFKHLSLEKHNQLIQFILFLKKSNYQHFCIRPELSLVELNLKQEDKEISIDIKIEKKQGLPLEQALIRDLAKRDFKLSTLFVCLLPGQDAYPIKGFDKALRSTNRKLISAVGQNPHIFTEDPVRLLRLIKYQLEHQDFSIDSQLSRIYRLTPWVQCFKSFYETSVGRGRLITHLQELFNRYGFSVILDELIRLKKIEPIFGIYNSEVKQTLSLLKEFEDQDSYTCRLNLFLFFYIHHATQIKSYEVFAENAYRKLLSSVPAQHRIYFQYVEHIIYQKPLDGYVAYKPLLNMLEVINHVYANQSQDVDEKKLSMTVGIK